MIVAGAAARIGAPQRSRHPTAGVKDGFHTEPIGQASSALMRRARPSRVFR